MISLIGHGYPVWSICEGRIAFLHPPTQCAFYGLSRPLQIVGPLSDQYFRVYAYECVAVLAVIHGSVSEKHVCEA